MNFVIIVIDGAFVFMASCVLSLCLFYYFLDYPASLIMAVCFGVIISIFAIKHLYTKRKLIIVQNAEVIPRCQLILEALGPELHVALRNKAVKDEFFPRGALIIEGIEASDVEKSRQLNDQPVMAGAIVAQLEGVLPDRLEDLNDQGIR